MMISPQAAAARLAANAEVFRAQLANLSDEQARWKPAPEKWSMLEVISHLADEERDDFRRRLNLILQNPEMPWPPIDPPRWAIQRRHNDRRLGDVLADFLRERDRSVEWLSALTSFDPEARHEHPGLGVITGGDLLLSWLAHDLIHIRQINRLHYEYLTHIGRPHSASYAGGW